MKTGRNKKCPCGSGKKYKKCCLWKVKAGIIPPYSPGNPIKKPRQEGDLVRRCKNFDPIDLLQSVAALLIDHYNTMFRFRLERAAWLILANHQDLQGNKKASKADLEMLLNNAQEMEEASIGEDPPEQLFTDTVCTHGGNYTVYPGIVAEGGYIVQQLLNSLFSEEFREKYNERFLKFVYFPVMALLAVSNEIANRAGHERYSGNDDYSGENLSIADETELSKLKNAVAFSGKQLQELMQKHNLLFDALTPFLTDYNSMQNVQVKNDEWYLLKKPLLKIGDTYLILTPTVITASIRHFILSVAVKGKEIKSLSECYHLSVVNSVKESLQLMHYNKFLIDWSEPDFDRGFSEVLVQIDNGIACYIQVVTDTGKDYSIENPWGTWDAKKLFKEVEQRQTQILQLFMSGDNPFIKHGLILTIIGQLGRFLVAGFGKSPSNCCFLHFTPYELMSMSRLRNMNELTLWKFAKSYSKLKDKTMLGPMASSLDYYTLYRNHNESFYMSDDAQLDGLELFPGFGRELLIESAESWDRHLVQDWQDTRRLVDVSRFHVEGDEIPIYFSVDQFFSKNYEQVVEGYAFPIWVGPKDIPQSDELRGTAFHLAETFAFWIWQLLPIVGDKLELKEPVRISFQLQNPSVWEGNTHLQEDTNEIPKFTIDIQGNEIILTLPDLFLQLASGHDNKAERYLINAILNSFNKYFSSKILFEEEIQQIIEEIAPLGLKRKFNGIDISSDIRLDNRYLPTFRKLSDRECMNQLDGLVDEISVHIGAELKVGPIADDDRQEINETILSIFLQRLRSKVNQYNYSELLEKAISLNEVAIREQEFNKYTAPYSAACYHGVYKQAKLVAERSVEIAQVSLTVRFLIEFLAAEPHTGAISISEDAFDEIMAIAYYYLHWGMMGDEIRCRVFPHSLSILASGRIGNDLKRKDLFEGFLDAKALEDVETAQENYLYMASMEETLSSDKADEGAEVEPSCDLERAILCEFGCSLSDIFSVLITISRASFSIYKSSSPSEELEKLIEIISEESEINEDTVRIVIEEFSYKPRGKWDTIPEGFEADDILPHRFIRRLSIIRRLLIMVNSTTDPEKWLVYWGPRHIENSIKYLYHLIDNGQFKQEHAKSKELKSYIGSMNDKLGKEFENAVYEWCVENLRFDARRNLPIAPRKFFDNEAILGDIDILLLDVGEKSIFCVECKRLNPSRNAVEIGAEIDMLFRKDPRKPHKEVRVDKHRTRMNWLKDNWGQVREKLNLDNGIWKIVPLFLTSLVIPSGFVFKPEYPIISFQTLKRGREPTLLNLANGDHVMLIGS